MGKDYSKDAYQLVYKHPQWKQTAQEYEDKFAANLYKSPYVMEAARTVLNRLSSMLMVYYGIKDKQKEEDIENRDMLLEVASNITGVGFEDEETERQILQGRSVLEDTLLSNWEGAGQIGDARKLGRPQLIAQYEKFVGPVDELGNVFDNEVVEYMQTMVNQHKIADVMNGDGNLREMMTMLYNGMILSGGRNKEQIANSRSLKNMLLNITEEDVNMMKEVGNKVRETGYDDPNNLPKGYAYGEDQLLNASIDFTSLRRLSSYQKRGDVFNNRSLASDLPKGKQEKKKKGNSISRWFAGIKRSLKAGLPRKFKVDKKKGDEIKGLGKEHYVNLGIAPSAREEAHALRKGEWNWKEGTAFYKRKMSSKGMLRIAGPSGTTLRMMGAYKLLGASKQELLNFRLALIGWMCTSRDHSLLEIMQGSHYAGIVGDEDLSEAATMYQTVSPLNTREIRERYAPDKRFPHETIFLQMLNELRDKRRALKDTRKGPIKDKYGTLFTLWNDKQTSYRQTHNINDDIHNAMNYKADDVALNIYTTDFYTVMNTSRKYNNFIGKKAFKNDSLEAAERKNSKIKDEIFDALRVAGRIAEDSMQERALEESALKDVKNVYDADENEAREMDRSDVAFRGITYRGGKIDSGIKKGGTFTAHNLTSTSQNIVVAAAFYEQLSKTSYENKALFCFRLNGKSAINITKVSTFEDEEEVLVPPNSKFNIVDIDEEVYINLQEGKVYRKDEITPEIIKAYEESRSDSNSPWRKSKYVILEEISGPGEDARKKAQRRDEKKKRAKEMLEQRNNF